MTRLILHKESLARAKNYLKMEVNYLYSSAFKKNVLKAKPTAASIEPANFCNLSCPQCPTGNGSIQKNKKLLGLEAFKQIIDALLPELIYLNLYFQGEPFINKDLDKMLAYARKKSIYCCVSTNGMFLSEERVKELALHPPHKLIVCLDGATKESYEQYRVGADFDQLTKGIKRLVAHDVDFEVQCLLLKSNENEQGEVRKLCTKLGAKKLTFKKAQFYDDFLMPEKEENRRYKRLENGAFVRKKPLKNRCKRLWSSVVISTEGEVLPCCFDKDASHSFGNLFETDFNTIWQGTKANKFRRGVLNNRSAIEICRNCVE